MNKSIVLVSGFTRMGKDYFVERLMNENLDCYSLWSVDPNFNLDLLLNPINVVKFATALKDEVSEMLGVTIEELEERKDKKLDRHYVWKYLDLNCEPLYRHVLIDHAEYERSLDEHIWVKSAANLCVENKLNVITDWRYVNEQDIGKFLNRDIIKVRVHRDGVRIPTRDLISEHYITEVPVDLLVLPKDRTPNDYDHIYTWIRNQDLYQL